MTSANPNILISSAGRRVALLRAFESATTAIGDGGRVFACDATSMSAAFHASAGGFVVPRCADAEFVPQLLRICRDQRIGLIVPTIDTELPVLSAARAVFAEAGVRVSVSDPETVRIGGDKVATHEWLVRNGFPTVRQWSLSAALSADLPWPCIAKPRFGSASIGLTRVESASDLEHLDPSADYLIQSVARGSEFTVDVLLVTPGNCVAAVPRKRLEVRAGEVSKGITQRFPAVEDLARRVASALPGAYGALNIQIFADPHTGDLAVIEINPRFGGGFPLSWKAGADFPLWLLQDLYGRTSTANNNWESELLMLRFDDAVFVSGQGAL